LHAIAGLAILSGGDLVIQSTNQAYSFSFYSIHSIWPTGHFYQPFSLITFFIILQHINQYLFIHCRHDKTQA